MRARDSLGLETIFSRKERAVFLQKSMRVLFITEYLMLVEYVEVVLPFVYSLHRIALFGMPNSAYYPSLAGLSSTELYSSVINVPTSASNSRGYILNRNPVAILLSAATATDPSQANIAKVVGPDSPATDRLLPARQHKRFLRVENTVDEDDEERGTSAGVLGKAFKKITSTIKNSKVGSKVRYQYWLKRGEDPQSILKKLGLKGLTPVEAEAKVVAFRDYLRFSKLWREQ
ncbi:hypothetical protein JM18_009017 [Phytophthora kernoviae]|uniref:RxLR effector protein n=1 Tax=Phytophthora kernoviae TaxID=325452 RepID=A0A921S915_9STRA|nr:hypothetical protein JM18_009017 [Phytophthora kernoviae]